MVDTSCVTQNKSIFLLIRTCGRAVNWILKRGIYFNCSGWEKAVLRRFYIYDTVKKEELCTVGMLEEENIEYNTKKYNTKFVKRHVAVASEALTNRTVKKHRRRRTNVL